MVCCRRPRRRNRRSSLKYPGPNPGHFGRWRHNGVVWVIESDNQKDCNEVLRAYDANNLATELYNTKQLPARDSPGGQIKYAVPTIANGMVYVGSAAALNVYGLTAIPPAATPAFSPANGSYLGRKQFRSLPVPTPPSTTPPMDRLQRLRHPYIANPSPSPLRLRLRLWPLRQDARPAPLARRSTPSLLRRAEGRWITAMVLRRPGWM